MVMGGAGPHWARAPLSTDPELFTRAALGDLDVGLYRCKRGARGCGRDWEHACEKLDVYGRRLGAAHVDVSRPGSELGVCTTTASRRG
jgi:hypothetical protein